MILIKEDTPKKLSGITSLFIKFDFNNKVLDIIKSCSACNYSKTDKLWEVSTDNLAYLLDRLTYEDDIQFCPLFVVKEKEYLLVVNYKTKPYQYQLEGIKYGINHDRWLLLDSMGLGKTLQVLYTALELKAQKGLKHCLIICGVNSIKANWKKEIELHTNESAVILGERKTKTGSITYATVKERAKQLKNKIDEFFIITNVETIRNEAVVDAFLNSENEIDMIVADEIHRMSNPHTRGTNSCQQSTNLLKLQAKYMIGSSGTLLLNNILDCFIPLKWIGVEKATLTQFKNQYCNLDFNHRIVDYKNLDLLKAEIEANSLRRTKDIIPDLPQKNIINEYVDMSETHRKFYDTIKDGIKEEIQKVVDKVKVVAQPLAMVTRLRQATVLPSMLSTDNIISSKLERAVDIATQCVASDEKVVIFSNYKEPCYVLAKELQRFNPLVVTGDTPADEMNKNVELFNTDLTKKIFICTIAKCGTGLSLHKQCSTAIFVDCAWTSGAQSQAEDRVNRIGSTKTCFIYRLICTDTIDEAVANIVDKKEALSEYVIDDKLTEKSIDILSKYIMNLC